MDENTQQIGVVNQMITAAKNAVTTLSNTSIMKAQTAYTTGMQDATLTEDQKTALYNTYQMTSQTALMASSASNSVFESASTYQLGVLNQKDQEYEQESTTVKNELALLSAESETYKDAISKAAKAMAPTFGLNG